MCSPERYEVNPSLPPSDPTLQLYEESFTEPPLDLLSSKVSFLRETIERLQERIDQRKRLSERFKTQLDSEMERFERTLEEVNSMWRMGDNLAMEQRRSHIEQRISDIREELRSDNLKRWKDIVWLERELTEVLKEYYSLVRAIESFREV